MKTVVPEKGQVTIPKACRDRLGLRAGTVLDLVARDGKLVAAKRPTEYVFRTWRGRARLPGGQGVDQYLDPIRK